MRKILILLFLAMVFAIPVSNAQCNYAVKDQVFYRAKQNIKNNHYQRDKFRAASRFVGNNCISVSQLIELCYLFSEDATRFRLSRKAYKNIVNKKDFFDVYDIFKQLSYAIKLYDFTVKFDSGNYDQPYDEDYKNTDYTGISFPYYTNYTGPTGINCKLPISDTDFEYLFNKINLERDVNKNLLKLKEIVARKCLATTHVMKLALLLDLEQDRLHFLKFAYNKTFDMNNFYQSQQIISHSYYKDDLIRYIDNYNAENIDNPFEEIIIEEECIVENDEHQAIIKAIKDARFSVEMKKLAKHYISTRCFSMEQYKPIFTLFVYENDRLEIMKFTYDYAPYPNKMFMFANLLRFHSSKTAYNNYIMQREKNK